MDSNSFLRSTLEQGCKVKYLKCKSSNIHKSIEHGRLQSMGLQKELDMAEQPKREERKGKNVRK